jgi:putative hydrolase of the HAD superfamily
MWRQKWSGTGLKKVVGFDLGYTLVYLQREKSYQEALQCFGIGRSVEEVELAQHWADKFFMREFQGVLGKQGDTFYPWYAGIVNYHLGVSVNLFELCKILKDSKDRVREWAVYPWTHGVLEDLKSQGCRLFLLSNWDSTARDVLNRFGLEPFFDEIIVSSEVSCEKPDPRIFELALKQMQAAPSEAIYVGDNYYDDCVGAGKLGISSLLLNRFDRFGIEEIQNQIVIPDIRFVSDYLEREIAEVG